MRIALVDTMPIQDRKKNPDESYPQGTIVNRKDRRKNKRDRRREERDGVYVSLSHKKDRRSRSDRRKPNDTYR